MASRVRFIALIFILAGACVAYAVRKEMVMAGFFKIYDPGVGEEERWYINDHCFIRGQDGTWHLFGITHAEPLAPSDEDNFAHATAKSLTQSPWKKELFALTVDPNWGEKHLWAPHVIFHNGLYYMYYSAGGEKPDKSRIHLATSRDMWEWTRHPENPVIVDGFQARDPFILKLGDRWVMYYTATSEPTGGNHIVASQTSSDLIHWGGRRAVFTDPEVGHGGGPTESPTVVRRGKYYYLFLAKRGGYSVTGVFRSEDPFKWDASKKALFGKIQAHAAEVIRDVDGKWYVSHCGWCQDGVYLAPLYFNDGLDENDTSMPIPKTHNCHSGLVQ